jgi:hypothetical protein
MTSKSIFLSRTLVICVILLLISMSNVSSNGNVIDNISSCTQILDDVDNSQELLSREKIAYGYIAYNGGSGHPEGPCYFPLYEPNNITSLGNTQSGDFLTGGTWTCDNRWFGTEYMTGILWEIDPTNGEMWSIGAAGCSDLSYNPVNKKLYCVRGSAIYEIDITTGEQYLTCNLSGEPNYLIGIAFDKYGILYGWNDSSLWIIDIETCEAEFVCPFSIQYQYIGNCHFDWDTNKLYLTAYTSGGQLYEVDIETGECTLVGNFEGSVEITALAISSDCENHPPTRPHIEGPPSGKAGVEYCISISSFDPDGDIVFYYIDWGDGSYEEWFGPYGFGVNVTKCHTYPLVTKIYEIRVKAKDLYGAESDWGKMYVFILNSRISDNLFFIRFLERFPILERLLGFFI